MPTRANRRNRPKPLQKIARDKATGDSTLLSAINRPEDCGSATRTLSDSLCMEEIMRLITPQSVNVANSKTGKTPLMRVVQKIASPHSLPLVRRMIEVGANVNAVDDEGTAVIMHVGGAEDKHVLAMLVEAGANIDEESVHCQCRHTLLISAVQDSDVEFAKVLIRLGADVNYKNKHGLPLQQAMNNGCTEMVELLVSSGALQQLLT